MNWNDVIRLANNGSPKPPKRVEKTDNEWKSILTAEEFQVTRKKGTDRAFSGEYCEAHEAGQYACRCCETTLFDSSLKYDSNSGWPSFTEPMEENIIKYEKDVSFGMVRVEVLCNVCDAHLGHVFPDGPEPTGLRYCINSSSIKLIK
ncbi:MAG: peptide-methionine (R)-S-oxide reductase [Bacteroidetes bacterium]|nr:MAG: peptide-methionine (R)-S-oxide reductase [Bacteroidota bacterium]